MPLKGGGGGGGSSGAVRAGGAFVEIFARDNLTGVLDKLKAKMNAFGSSLQGAGFKLAGVGAAIVAPFAVAADHFREVGDSLADMSQRTGVAVESLSRLNYAASLSGTSLEDLEAALKRMAAGITGAGEEAEFAGPAFERLGLSLDTLAGLDAEGQFLAIADALARVEDPTTRAGLAMQAFGKAGTNLIPLLADGVNGIREMTDEADRLGLTISGDAAAAGAELDDALAKLKATMSALVFEIGGAVAPAFRELFGGLGEGAAVAKKFIADNRALVLIIAGVGTALATAGVALVAFGVTAKVAAVGVGVLSGAVGAMLSPMALTAAAIGGLGYLFVTQTEVGKAFGEAVGQAFTDLADTATTAWEGISHALQRGDLAAAADVAFAGIQAAWARIVLEMTKIWNGVKATIADTFRDAKAGFKGLLAEAGVAANWLVGNGDAARAEADAFHRRNLAERDAKQVADNAARAGDVAEAERALGAAKARLAAIVAEEIAKPLPAANVAEAAKKAGGSASLAAVQQQLAAATKGLSLGSLSGRNVVQALAVGDKVNTAEKQLKTQQQQLAEQKRTREAVEELGKLLIVS